MNDNLKTLLFDELRQYTDRVDKSGGFIPAVKQLANVAALPGVVDVLSAPVDLIRSMSAQLPIHIVAMDLLLETSQRSIWTIPTQSFRPVFPKSFPDD